MREWITVPISKTIGQDKKPYKSSHELHANQESLVVIKQAKAISWREIEFLHSYNHMKR